MRILIVGGVAGGATAAARIRRLDESAEIIMFERGEYISFANCGLPYYIGGKIKDRDELLRQTPQSFNSRFNVDVRVFSEVLSIDRENSSLKIKNLKTNQVYTERYDKLILSPGAMPIKPKIEGVDSKRVFTLRNIEDTDKIFDFISLNKPSKAVVVGGGFIGLEMAENLSHAGIDVSIVELASQVLTPIDSEMSAHVHKHLREKGVDLFLNNGLQRIQETKNGLSVHLQNGNIDADFVVLAIGVVPESGLASVSGLKLNQRGGIVVDKTMRTTDENIFAVGDAVEITDFVTKQATMIPLASPANKQARIAADNICGGNSQYNGSQGSSVLKIFDLTVATSGINEKTAVRLGLDYDKIYLWSESHAGYYPSAKPMAIKVIFESNSGKILGAQIVGFEGVDKRCDVFAVAIRAGMTAFDLTELDLCYAPPYSSTKDPVNMAGFVIENILKGKTKNFHFHDVDALPRDGSVTLLDVRTPIEAMRGSIEGFKNIPLDDLRNHLDELDKTKPIYVHCQSGMRSYFACRILKGNGFDAFNLSGGYIFYSTAKRYSI